MGATFYQPTNLYNQSLDTNNPYYSDKIDYYRIKNYLAMELTHFEFACFAVPDKNTRILGYSLEGDVPKDLTISDKGIISGITDHYGNQDKRVVKANDNTPVFASGDNNGNNGRPLEFHTFKFDVIATWEEKWNENSTSPDFVSSPCANLPNLKTGKTVHSVSLALMKNYNIDNYIYIVKMLDKNKATLSGLTFKDFPQDAILVLPDVNPLYYTAYDTEPVYQDSIITTDPNVTVDTYEPIPVEDIYNAYLIFNENIHPDLNKAIQYARSLGAKNITMKDRIIINSILYSDGERSPMDRIKILLGISEALKCTPGFCKGI